MIGKPRGKKGSRSVFVYDPRTRKKRYVGSRVGYKEARDLEREWETRIKGVTARPTIDEFKDDPGVRSGVRAPPLR